MHPEVRQDHPGRCPKCGMKLIKAEEVQNSSKASESDENSYRPLFVIVVLIMFVTFVVGVNESQRGHLAWSTVMMNFMAGFFLVFSGFKLIDLKGFAEGYSMYDLLAKKVFGYGYVYPFLELGLGLLYLTHNTSPLLPIFTVILMTFSGLGVAIKLLKHEKFQCACLGTFLKVPLTKVTLIEDFGMALMAGIMFFQR